MHAAPRVCVVGSANVDLTFRTSRLPRPGETLAGHSFHLGLGGKGANQAVAAARLGAAVALVARLGGDAFGQEALHRYRAEGLDTAFVRADPELPTGAAAIVVDDQAQNCILVVAGANAALSPADVREAAPAIRTACMLLCQLEVPLVTTLEALQLARAAGVRTVLTPAPAAELPDEAYRLCDLCVPNETEAGLLTGREVGDVGAAEAAARELRRRGAGAVVVTLGERGALLLDDGGPTHIRPSRCLRWTRRGRGMPSRPGWRCSGRRGCPCVRRPGGRVRSRPGRWPGTARKRPSPAGPRSEARGPPRPASGPAVAGAATNPPRPAERQGKLSGTWAMALVRGSFGR
jgi:ribokinase